MKEENNLKKARTKYKELLKPKHSPEDIKIIEESTFEYEKGEPGQTMEFFD